MSERSSNPAPAAALAAPAAEIAADAIAASLAVEQLKKLIGALQSGRATFERELLETFSSRVQSAVPGPEAVPSAMYGLLKLLSDDQRSWPRWQALATRDAGIPSREEVVSQLWQWLDEGESSYVEEEHFSRVYHRHRIFDWLLGRYDLLHARAVWTQNRHSWVRFIHLPLFFAIFTVAVWSASPAWLGGLGGSAPKLVWAALAAAYLAAIALQAASFRRKASSTLDAVGLACQSLIPRLAGASAVGLMVLASSQELLTFVVASSGSDLRIALLLLAGLAYLGLEMFRRQRPMPHFQRLVRLMLDTAATGFAHSLALAVAAAPGLRLILNQNREHPFGDLQLLQVLHIAAFLFIIGLIVNLIWAEEAVTQPL